MLAITTQQSNLLEAARRKAQWKIGGLAKVNGMGRCFESRRSGFPLSLERVRRCNRHQPGKEPRSRGLRFLLPDRRRHISMYRLDLHYAGMLSRQHPTGVACSAGTVANDI